MAAVFLASVIVAGILLASGTDPLAALSALLKGAFGSQSAIGRTLEKSTPLIFNGLAVAFAFKAGLFNIGTQGQLLLGALVAAAAGSALQGLPGHIHAPLALLAGASAGALFGMGKGLLKAYTGAHEVITGIMLNYVAINLTDFFASGPLKDPTPGNIIARTPEILATSRLPSLFGISAGFPLAIAVAIGVWWILTYTPLGFEVRTVGGNHHAARSAGIGVSRTIVLTMFFSGMLAGMGGAVETQCVVHRFQPGFNTGLGFEGITIALMGRTHPVGVVLASILVGAMKAGTNLMQFRTGVSRDIVDVIQALILFFVAADSLLRRWLSKDGSAAEKIVLTKGWGKLA